MSEDYTYPPTPRMVRADELDAAKQDIALLLSLLKETIEFATTPWREVSIMRSAEEIRERWEVQP